MLEEIGRVKINVRPTCPGMPWGVHGPKTMAQPTIASASPA